MKISRENYEIWFTDWLDNNLTSLQTDELYAFLELNRDLRDEFNALGLVRLKPEQVHYSGRDRLQKSAAEIDDSQFDLLCAAMVENDLSASQVKEMQKMISSDEERKKTAEIFAMIKLHPSGEAFSGKKKLLHQTAGQKIIRLAVIGLSAAAIIAIIITTGLFKQSVSPSFPEIRMASNLNEASSPVIQQPRVPVTDPETSEMPVTPPEKTGEQTKNLAASAAPVEIIEREQSPDKIAFNVTSSLVESTSGNSLVASNVRYVPEAGKSTDDSRSNVGRFLAHTFRSKVLDEASDEPLKGYEIAEVGINGINKLLGWEMALSRNNNEGGEVQSVYFSSKMLKFNAPVKNNDVAE